MAQPVETTSPQPPAPLVEEAAPVEPAEPTSHRRTRKTSPRPAVAAPVSAEVADTIREMAAELGFIVQEDRWFRQALYHTSYVHELGRAGISSNERLEFLGDAVLDLAVGHHLFERYPDMSEGELSRLRAAVVRASTLASRARLLGLGRFALLGRGEEKSGGRRRPNFLADLFEAIVGAIFLDQGIEAATGFVLRSLREDLEVAAEGREHANYKAMLQEAVQRDQIGGAITYGVVSAEGPDHAPVWRCEVRIGGRRFGTGQGRNKKAAEQDAARDALLRGWNHAESGPRSGKS